jgi:hypothetical protein
MKISTLLTRLFASSVEDRTELSTIAVTGAFRCGTNYLKFLLELNYWVTADFSKFGWKHAGVPILAPGSGLKYPSVPICYVVKNPYAFVVSMHTYYMTTKASIRSHEAFDRFLTEPMIVLDSQLENSPQMRFANPVQYWNYIYWNLETLSFERFRVEGFGYEELIADPSAIRRVERLLPLKRKSEEIVVPRNALKRLGGESATVEPGRYETEEKFDSSFYLNRKYLKSLSRDHVAFINRQVDPWLMKRRNYPLYDI